MNITGIREQDIVEVDIRGLRFYAIVVQKLKGKLEIEPLSKGISYRSATARQIVTRYRRCKNGVE